jgi:hypothetical protein
MVSSVVSRAGQPVRRPAAVTRTDARRGRKSSRRHSFSQHRGSPKLDLDAAPLGVAPERGFRPSLPGFQRKALLGRAPDGTWQLPNGDAPSTWILKPRAVALAVGLKDAVAQFLSATPSTGIELTGVGHGPFDKMGLICPTLGP